MMDWLLLVVGFALLVKGADWFVDGAAGIAGLFHIPTVIVGLTIVALGTSLPELSVSLNAAIQGRNALALSNVLGSNIFNTLVVVGCSCLIRPFVLDKEVRKRDVWFNLAAIALLTVLAMSGIISRTAGLVLLAFLVVYLGILIVTARKEEDTGEAEEAGTPPSFGKCLLLLVVGGVCIAIGGKVTVDSASAVALALGMSEALVGLTIVSIGTSLPELVTSVVAANKGESGLSIGNALGSNIMNICFILGLSAAIHPIAVIPENWADILILLAVSAGILLYAKWTDKMSRATGAAFLAAYLCYFAWILVR